jgi:uncharacterized protein (DUF2062 family)
MDRRSSRTPTRLQRLVHTLRTEGGSRAREAWAIGIGFFIGCSPFIGLHLALAIAIGWLFRLNRLKIYLAANLVNPLILPAVLFAEVQLGSWMRRGDVYSLSLQAFRETNPWHFGADLLLGSVLVGGIAGVLAGLVTFIAMGRAYRDPLFSTLVARAADRYLGESVTAWEFARAKLRRDPVYRAVLTRGLLPERGALWDVGCGQGLLLALVAEARRLIEAGEWPAEWGAPPAALELRGVELRPRVAAMAGRALDGDATIVSADARDLPIAGADAIVAFDVLHLMAPADQDALVARLARSLGPGGRLLIREADASAGWRFRMVRFGNRVTALAQRRWRATLAFRTADEWRALCARCDLKARIEPMGDGTPFANVLIVALKREGGQS